MRESVIDQEIEAQGIRKGRTEGRAEGRMEGEAALVLRLLKRKVGNLDPRVETRVRGLSVSQLEELGEA